MRFLPFERLEIRSSLPPHDAIRALEGRIKPCRFLRTEWGKPFQGKIVGGQFKIRRILWYGNGFLPIVLGRIESDQGGSRIKVLMRPSHYCVVFLFFGLFFLGLFTLLALTSLLAGESVNLGGVAFVGLFWAFCVIDLIFFRMEVRKAAAFLQELFAGETTEGDTIFS